MQITQFIVGGVVVLPALLWIGNEKEKILDFI
jgi:hypothetical protein